MKYMEDSEENIHVDTAAERVTFMHHGKLGKKSELQMGFEPTTLRDLVGCSALITELLETPWRAREKCGSLTRTASRNHIVKSI